MHNVGKLAVIMCLALNTSGAFAAKSKGAENLLADTAGKAQISVDENTGYARFIRLTPNSQLGPLTAQTRSSSGTSSAKVDTGSISLSFLRDYGSAFGIKDVDTELTLVGTNRDKLGSQHSIFKQNYMGLPVFAGELRTHFNSDGEMIAVNGKFLTDIKVVTKPVITLAQATRIAFVRVEQDPTKEVTSDNLGNREDKMGTSAALSVNSSVLMVFRAGLIKGTPGQDHLAYEIEVVNSAGNVREFVYVDALNGEVVDQITGIHDALDRRAYDAESSAHPGPNYPASPFWTEGDPLPTSDIEADNMIYASAETYSFFDNAFGRDSFDAAGATMDAIFNRGDSCPNASWNGTYISFCPGLTSDDITAHEWAHAYTQYTNNLIYQWQSGALNESYSDIWGETVDRINGREDSIGPDVARTDGNCSVYSGGTGDDSVRWLMGEDSTGFGGAIRDMWDPTCYGDPGKVTDDEYYCLTTDFGGVHANSGVPNHAYALMVDGGSYNGFTDTGLGLTKSAHIHWAAQNMLTPSSNFYDHADALETACSALTGLDLSDLSDGSPTGEIITASDCLQVSAIIDAVEFRTSPTQCGFEPLLAEAPPLCESMGSVESFFNEDFESGALPAGWSVSSHDVADPATFDSPGWLVVDNLPPGANGLFAAFAPDLLAGDCALDTEAGAVSIDSPVIVLPASPTPHVAFNHWVSTEAGWDGGNLKISVNGGAFVIIPSTAYSFNPLNGVLTTPTDNPLGGEEAFTGTDGGSLSGSWGQSQIDLIGLASPGDNIQLRFDFGTDGCNGSTGWYVESVEAYSCSAEVPPICGDSQLDLGEMCDDGNSISGDGCSASCQVESGFACTIPTSSVSSSNIVADWSFEGGVPNGDWLASSTFDGISEFPLCGPSNGCPAVPTSTGSWVIWIGGIGTGVTSSVAQDITIPTTATEITINTLRGLCDAPEDSIEISIDSNVIGTVVCDATDSNYAIQTYSVAPYNDGLVHSLEIGGTVGGTNGSHSNFFVDDITIEDNISVPATPSVCVEVVTDIACNASPVGFDSGIAASWAVVDNAGTGVVWSDIAGSEIGGNFTGGSGDAATVNSDAAAFVEFDTELHSNSFSLEGFTGATLEYLVDYQNLASLDFLNLDISTDGGSSWTNILIWNEDHPVGGLFTTTGELVSVDLAQYAGETDVKLRWHYFDPNSGDWDWYAQIDDVSLTCDNVPQALRCDVNLDGFVDRTDVSLIGAGLFQPAPSGDPRDNDGDGVISIVDMRQCTQLCTLPRCATPTPE